MITYTNRKGSTYYLKVGTTKTGKPRYYASTNFNKGANAEAMPADFAFRENVNGQVSVGKPQPTQIKHSELTYVQKLTSTLNCDCREETKGDTIILHTAEKFKLTDRLPARLRAKAEALAQQTTLYQAMLRFTLVDPSNRQFQTERMCFMGEPDWLQIGSAGTLTSLASKYVPLLDDHDALFEEIY